MDTFHMLAIKSACIDTFTPYLFNDLKKCNLYESFMEDIQKTSNFNDAYSVTINYINKCFI